MRVDPQVTARKFQRQVGFLAPRRDALRQKRCQIVRAEFPYVEALMFPVRSVLLPDVPVLVPHPEGPYVLPNGRFAPGKISLFYPYLAPRCFGLRLDFSDFDQRAPAVSFHDPLTWDHLPPDQVPPAAINSAEVGARKVLIDGHPETQRPFLCMRYIREYHEHPQHTDDPWVWYRGLFSLPNLLEQIASAFIQPIPVVGPGIFPHNKLLVSPKE